jgi:hypothetical protein
MMAVGIYTVTMTRRERRRIPLLVHNEAYLVLLEQSTVVLRERENETKKGTVREVLWNKAELRLVLIVMVHNPSKNTDYRNDVTASESSMAT